MIPIVESAREVRRALGRMARRAVRRMRGKPVPEIIGRVREQGLSYLGENALFDLYDQVRRVEEQQIDGLLIEAGCALGGSAILIADAKKRDRPLAVYDVFGMIPPPSDQDEEDVHARYQEIVTGESKGIGGATYYGYEEDLLSKVRANFAAEGYPLEEHRVRLIQGLFQDTLHIDEPVAMAHIDGDWYESVMTCLERIEPYLVTGGVLIIDDYDAWSGCRKAVDDYFADKSAQYEFMQRSRLHIVRTAG